MKVHQILLRKMANFAYILEDEGSQKGILVDPSFEVKKVLRAARSQKIDIIAIVNTHGHSDHTAGNREAQEATGAPLMIHKEDAKALKGMGNKALSRILGGKGSPAPSRLLSDGDHLEIGLARVSVIHTPGHTRGSICLYTPGHLITGDTLFAGAVGRTDLPGGSLKTLKKSVRERIFTLPDDTTIWPGHHYGPTPTSTVKHEKEHNPFLQ